MRRGEGVEGRTEAPPSLSARPAVGRTIGEISEISEIVEISEIGRTIGEIARIGCAVGRTKWTPTIRCSGGSASSCR
jgi:hypothetical protein